MSALSRSTLVAIVLSTSALAATQCVTFGPCYSAAGIVNAASNQPSLAQFTWVRLYGTSLSFTTTQGPDGALPSTGEVVVTVNGEPALISYVSPGQVNFLMPFERGTTATVQLMRAGWLGPTVTVPLADSAPALFLKDPVTAIAAHPDWTLITPESPAHGGEYAILYATGLGQFTQPLGDIWTPAQSADLIARRKEFTILLDGQPVDDRLIEYAGAAPLMIGIYQINLKLPETVNKNPEIRIGLGKRLSPAGIHLTVE